MIIITLSVCFIHFRMQMFRNNLDWRFCFPLPRSQVEYLVIHEPTSLANLGKYPRDRPSWSVSTFVQLKPKLIDWLTGWCKINAFSIDCLNSWYRLLMFDRLFDLLLQKHLKSHGRLDWLIARINMQTNNAANLNNFPKLLPKCFPLLFVTASKFLLWPAFSVFPLGFISGIFIDRILLSFINLCQLFNQSIGKGLSLH